MPIILIIFIYFAPNSSAEGRGFRDPLDPNHRTIETPSVLATRILSCLVLLPLLSVAPLSGASTQWLAAAI
jgi:hypothetical protein